MPRTNRSRRSCRNSRHGRGRSDLFNMRNCKPRRQRYRNRSGQSTKTGARMTPYEIMLSESQERMLIIAKRGREDVVRQVFDKWDVPCAEIGRVTSDGIMRVRNNGTIAAEIPAKALADEAPLYSREARHGTAESAEDAELIKKISANSE